MSTWYAKRDTTLVVGDVNALNNVSPNPVNQGIISKQLPVNVNATNLHAWMQGLQMQEHQIMAVKWTLFRLLNQWLMETEMKWLLIDLNVNILKKIYQSVLK